MAKEIVAIGNTGGQLVSKLANNFDELYASKLNKSGSSVAGTLANDLGGLNNTVNGDECFTFGSGNEVIPIVARGKIPSRSQALGLRNSVHGYSASAIGQDCIVDGELGFAIGNTNVCTGNDALAIGSQCVTGRRRYTPVAHGADDPGLGSGNKAYVLIDPAEGDVTAHFPTTIIYIDPPINTLMFAMHPYCMLKYTEQKALLFLILKAEYTAGVGTKVWYDRATDLGAGYDIFGSYSPSAPEGEVGGNSMVAEGKATNAVGYGSHSEGFYSKAWGEATHAEGKSTIAKGNYSHSEGQLNISSGQAAHSEGGNNIASGVYSHSEGAGNIASGIDSHAEGYINNALGVASHCEGYGGSANRDYQHAQGGGKFSVNGDAQYTRDVIKKSCVGAGWHDMIILYPIEYGKSYAAETLLVGKQFSTTNGMVGESAAYKLKWFCARGAKYDFSTDDVNVDDNIITVAQKLTTNTPVLLETTGTLPDGLNIHYAFYAIYVDDTHIKLSATVDGDAVDITSQGSGTHSYSKFSFGKTTNELLGRSFLDDGDTVGDGSSTGIMANLHTTYFSGGRIRLRIDQIATRSIRWVATTQYSEVM